MQISHFYRLILPTSLVVYWWGSGGLSQKNANILYIFAKLDKMLLFGTHQNDHFLNIIVLTLEPMYYKKLSAQRWQRQIYSILVIYRNIHFSLNIDSYVKNNSHVHYLKNILTNIGQASHCKNLLTPYIAEIFCDFIEMNIL